jgi:hypothetical protein
MRFPFRPAAPALFALALIACLPARAADGRIPISAAPFTISSPGSYYLTQDLSFSTGNGITLSTSGHVTLDLNGRTLAYTGGLGTSDLIHSAVMGAGAEIRNGVLRGGARGIYLLSYGPVNIRNVRTLELQSSGTAAVGIYVQGALNSGGARYPPVTIEDCALFSYVSINGTGIYVDSAAGVRISGNQISGWGGTNATALQGVGIFCGGCVSLDVSRNQILLDGMNGVYIGKSGAGGLSYNGVIAQNTVSAGTAAANRASIFIESAGNFLIDHNQLATSHGLYFNGTSSTGSFYQNNLGVSVLDTTCSPGPCANYDGGGNH